MPGAQVLQRPALGAAHQLVHRPLPLVGPGAHHDGPGEVGAVSVHLGAEIEQQPVAPAHRPRAGARVGQRRAGAGGDDRRERMPLAPPAAQRGLEPAPISSSLCPTSIVGKHLGERVLGQLRGGPDRGHFLGRLDRPQPLHQVGRRAPPGSGSGRRPARHPCTVSECASMPSEPCGQPRQHPAQAVPDAASGPPRPSPRRRPRRAPASRSGSRSPARSPARAPAAARPIR